jgi:sigma-B regulation protein RsbU (phosphoserine phosphatase)
MERSAPPAEPKLLYRTLESLFDTLDPARPPRELLVNFLRDLFRLLRDDLKLRGAVLYDERSDGFERTSVIPEDLAPTVETLDPRLPALKLIFRHRSYLFADSATADSPHDLGILPPGPAAAIAIGDTPDRRLFFFLFEPSWEWEKVDFTLNTIRVALSSRLIEQRARGSVLAAAEIQRSLLVEEPPPFPGYDIACRSIPAEEVGGDFYDFTNFDGEWLGLAIGDASGHGLPAALLVRDVVTGLRMGIEKDLKVGYTFRKLNRVIHRSRLSSRFVSLFYGELEPNGNLIYVNGGHLPPLLFLAGQTISLSTGGSVIGPLPEARFKRGFVHFDKGATLLLYTDGLVERQDAGGDFFGVERLQELVREHPGDTSTELLDRIFAAVYGFGAGRPWNDDATAVVMKRHPPKA